MKRFLCVLALSAVALAQAASAPADKPAKPAAKSAKADAGKSDKMSGKMSATTADEVKWMDAPNAFPAGAKLAVLRGDPSKPGPLTVRLKMPDGYKIGCHWHPAGETVTTLSGEFSSAMGSKCEGEAKPLGAGGFATMAAHINHTASAKGDTVIQVDTTGPFAITYVDPKDDPRKSGDAAKPAAGKKKATK